MEPVISFGSYECGCETVAIFKFRSWWPKSDYSLLTFYERKSICEHYQIQKLAFSRPLSLLSLFLCHFDNVKTSSPTVARSIWTVMCMFAGRKVDGCQQSFIVISGTSPGSHSSASMYIIFLWRQLCEKFLLGALQNFTLYFFCFLLSSLTHLTKKHQTVVNRMSGYTILLVERNPYVNVNTLNLSLEWQRTCLHQARFICLIRYLDSARQTYISCGSILKFSLPQVISDLIIVLEKIIISLCMRCNPFPTWLSHCSYAIITSFN